MNIAVLSGKGGTGKTFISVNLAAAFNDCTYIDCDVEEPNGHLFLKTENFTVSPVTVKLPQFDFDKCTGCRKCVDFCHFNALAFIKEKPLLFNSICHSCMGCKIVCPNSAVNEKEYKIGEIKTGKYKNITVKSGKLDIGKESGVPIIEELLKNNNSKTTVIDCPPGSACSVTSSIKNADFCIIAAEPTLFGVHNFKMVYKLVKLLKKPFGVVINKYYSLDNPMENLCKELQLPVLGRIPFNKETARINSQSKILYEQSEEAKKFFDELLLKISEVLK